MESQSNIISTNPANGQEIGQVKITTLHELDQIIDRAWSAFHNSGWKDKLPNQRAEVLRKIASKINEKRDELANLQMLDNGKPLAECIGMVNSAVGTFNYYASVCETWEGNITPPRGDYVSLNVLEPYGVIAAITPWNSPIMNDATKVAPALAAGNAVILKPSEDSPLLAPKLAEIALEAGLPEGLLQVVQGYGHDIGAALVAHNGVRMISFTGGTVTGRHIGKVAGERLIPVALELGGKSPHIVFDDANLEHAVAAVAAGIFGSSGQSCVAGSRLLLQRSIYQKFLEQLVARTEKINVTAPDDPKVEVGPLASFHHRDRVAQFVERARQEGGNILCGGYIPTGDQYDCGAYYMPTIIDGLENNSKTCQEEAFGPVLVVVPFDDEADAIKIANDSNFGLAAGIWTEDFKKMWRMARAVEAGSVWVNTYKQSITTTAFGGFKDSGIGREKGLVGLQLYAQIKSIYLGMHDKPLSIAK